MCPIPLILIPELANIPSPTFLSASPIPSFGPNSQTVTVLTRSNIFIPRSSIDHHLAPVSPSSDSVAGQFYSTFLAGLNPRRLDAPEEISRRDTGDPSIDEISGLVIWGALATVIALVLLLKLISDSRRKRKKRGVDRSGTSGTSSSTETESTQALNSGTRTLTTTYGSSFIETVLVPSGSVQDMHIREPASQEEHSSLPHAMSNVNSQPGDQTATHSIRSTTPAQNERTPWQSRPLPEPNFSRSNQTPVLSGPAFTDSAPSTQRLGEITYPNPTAASNRPNQRLAPLRPTILIQAEQNITATTGSENAEPHRSNLEDSQLVSVLQRLEALEARIRNTTTTSSDSHRNLSSPMRGGRRSLSSTIASDEPPPDYVSRPPSAWENRH